MQNFDIADIQILPIQERNGLLAFVSLVVNQSLYLSSIAIHRKLDGSGLRLTYPTKQAGGKNRNIFHPLTPELSLTIERTVFDEYKRLYG